MSKARDKGTRGENYFLPRLRALFYPALPTTDKVFEGTELERKHPLQRLDNAARMDRAQDGDYVGVPWMHEAKYTDRAGLTGWIRKARQKCGTDWVLLWKGDTRTLDGQPIVVMPLEKYEELVTRGWEDEAA